MDELDRIIAHLETNVKPKNTFIEENLKEIDWDKLKPVPNQSGPKTDSIGEINQAYTRIEERARLNNLTDSFRLYPDTQIESATTRSLKETLASFTRQNSILQDFE